MPLEKQFKMLQVILHLYDRCKVFVNEQSIPVSHLQQSGIFETVIKMKYDIENDHPEKFDAIIKEIDALSFD